MEESGNGVLLLVLAGIVVYLSLRSATQASSGAYVWDPKTANYIDPKTGAQVIVN